MIKTLLKYWPAGIFLMFGICQAMFTMAAPVISVNQGQYGRYSTSVHGQISSLWARPSVSDATFRSYTAHDRAVLRQQATFTNISAGRINTGDGLNLNNVTRVDLGNSDLTLVAGGTNLGIGVYKYSIRYVTVYGYTGTVSINSVAAAITTDSSNRKVSINLPVINDARIIGRVLYRTKVGSTASVYLLATINNNTDTTYVDNIADTSLVTLGNIHGMPQFTTGNVKLDGNTILAVDNVASNVITGSRSSLAAFYGYYNNMYGIGTGAAITTGEYNNLYGTDTGRFLTTGVYNALFGDSAGRWLTGSYNVGIGPLALYGTSVNPPGSNNVGIGYKAGSAATTGGINIGTQSGQFERRANNLHISSLAFTNQTTARQGALIYGTQSATASLQTLTTNSNFTATYSTTTPILNGGSTLQINAGADGYTKFGTASAYDQADVRLGIGTQAPSATMDAYSSIGGRGRMRVGSATNYGIFDQALGLRFAGNTTTWNDLRIEPTARTGVGIGTAPSFKAAYGTSGATGFYSYAFAQTTSALEYLYYAMQMPHDWKEGSTISPHIHFSTAATTGTVKWKGTCYGANHGGTFASFGNWSSTTTLSGDAWKHNIGSGSPVNMSAKTISMIMNCNVVRKAGDTAAEDAFMHYIDYHYEVDSLGSDTEYGKTATP